MSDIDKMNIGLKWYVAHTYSGYENKVKVNLEKIVENRGLGNLIYDIKVPVETIIEKDGDKEKVQEVKIFPSYVFVKMIMSDATWHIVRNITGSAGFVGPEGRPVPLTAKEIEKLGIESVSKTVEFKVGDSVSIKSGPMKGFLGTISEISSDLKTVTVMTSVFGHSTPVELDITSIAAENN